MYILFAAGALLWGPLSKPAAAQPGVTIGFAIGDSGLVTSSEQGEAIGRYLANRLAIPVRVRSFASDEPLYVWLTRYREVDVAWLGSKFLSGVPAGQLHVLATAEPSNGTSSGGAIVARQGLNAALQQQAQAAFLQMHDNAEGKPLIASLGLESFSGNNALAPSGAVTSAAASGRPDERLLSPRLMPIEEPQIVGAEKTTTAAPTEVIPGTALPDDAALGEVTGSAAPRLDAESPISLAADSLAYQSADDSYEAQGDVVLRQGAVELKADTLLWQAATQDAAARGAVQMRDAGTEIQADQLQYNLATGQGLVRGGQMFVREGNFHLTGGQIEKLGETEFRVEQGSFTTCDGLVPDWKFSADEVDVTLGGYAEAKHVWFHVKDIPVLYTPYLLFPVKSERESGLLAPWFGYSNNKGMRASLAWYQVIDRHMDATLYLDYLSEIGLGKGAEYRYALAGQNNGKALYYHVTGISETPDLYYLAWEHRGELPAAWKLTADVKYADDAQFFDEFGETAEDYKRDKLVSTLMLRRNWEKLNLVGLGRYIKDLEADNDATLQRLPELALALTWYRLGDTPFYLGLESYATRFHREEGEDGERLYLRPSVAASFKPGGWLEILPELSLHERVYKTDAGQEDQAVPEASLTLSARLVKHFDVDMLGMDRIQHSIEPSLKYTYVSDEFQGDLPDFDHFDRIESQNKIGYAVINRLTGRSRSADGTPSYREFFYLRLSQAYDVDEARHNRTGKTQPFSDLRVELEFHPTRNISFETDSLVPVYGDTRFNRVSAIASVHDERGNAAKLDYVYNDEEFTGVASDYLRFQLDTSLFDPFFVRVENRYDFREKQSLEKVLGLEYRSQCWSLLLTYRNRYREGSDDDHEVMLNFVLAGLGKNQGFGNGFDQLSQ